MGRSRVVSQEKIRAGQQRGEDAQLEGRHLAEPRSALQPNVLIGCCRVARLTNDQKRNRHFLAHPFHGLEERLLRPLFFRHSASGMDDNNGKPKR